MTTFELPTQENYSRMLNQKWKRLLSDPILITEPRLAEPNVSSISMILPLITGIPSECTSLETLKAESNKKLSDLMVVLGYSGGTNEEINAKIEH